MAEQQPSASAIPSTQEQSEPSTYGRGIWISYKVSIWSRIRSSLYSIARFFRIMSSPSNDPLAEFNHIDEGVGYDHVEGFCTSLSNFYKSAATFSIDRKHDRWQVAKISTYKSETSLQHESLVAEVVCGQMKVYLRIERKIHKHSIVKKTKDLIKRKLKSKSKAQASSDSDPSPDSDANLGDPSRPIPSDSLSKKIASDEITYSETEDLIVIFEKEECIDVIDFPEGKRLTLPQIAVLARTVNSMGRAYKLNEENCYWFAYIMVETAKQIKPDFSKPKEQKQGSKSKNKQGTWGNMLTSKRPTLKMIGEAQTEYNEAWLAFEKDIHDTINNPNSDVLREEQQKRKEEEQKRKEVERLAAEQAEEIKQLKALLAARDGANSGSS